MSYTSHRKTENKINGLSKAPNYFAFFGFACPKKELEVADNNCLWKISSDYAKSCA